MSRAKPLPAAAARGYSAVVQVKTTTVSGRPILVESGQCMGTQAETKTVT